jgi:hypothetical protein
VPRETAGRGHPCGPAGRRSRTGLALPSSDGQRVGGCCGGFCRGGTRRGVTPWQIDSAQVEDDVFHLAVSQPPGRRNLTVEGCRILALNRQFRERIAAFYPTQPRRQSSDPCNAANFHQTPQPVGGCVICEIRR